MQRTLNKKNIDQAIKEYKKSIKNVGDAINGKIGVDLFRTIKQDKIQNGPYPNVTLFEAANRIMTDLVILYGVKWLFEDDTFSFESYTVEYGNENNNSHDILASNEDHQLSGEAFNVAKSFYQGKKNIHAKQTTQTRKQINF